MLGEYTLFWLYKESLNWILSIELTYLNLLFIWTVLIVTIIVIRFSQLYIRHSTKTWTFIIWVFLFVLSILILLIRKSWWVLFLGWEGLGLTRFWLVAFYTRWVAHNGRILTFLTNRLGDTCLIVVSLYWLRDLIFQQQIKFNLCLWLLLFTGLWTKRAQYPFIRWLPAAISAPTPVSALVHSSTLVTAGLYLLIKFNWVKIFTARARWWLGTLTLIVGSWAALLDLDLKKVVAFSTLRQLGLIFLLFSSKRLCVIIYHIITHAFFKRSLFICVGVIITISYSTQSAHLYSSFNINSLTHFSWFVLTLINLTALPYIRGFYSKENRMSQTLSFITGSITVLLFILLSLTFLYRWRILIRLSLKDTKNIILRTPYIMNYSASLINIFFYYL